MNDTQHPTTLLPDDPKLTAYALGELEGEERAAVEAALRHDPAARAVVEEIRATAAHLEAALGAEGEETEGQEDGETAKRGAAAMAPDPYARKAKLLRFPQLTFIGAGLAAAGFAVFVALRSPPPLPAPKTALAESPREKRYLDMRALLPERDGPAAPVADSVFGARVSDAKKSFSLLGESKDLERKTTGGTPLALSLVTQSPEGAPAFGPGSQKAAAEIVNAQVTATPGGGRVLTHPQDDKFVVEARPANTPAPATSVAAPAPTGAGEQIFLQPFTVSADRFQGRIRASAPVANGAPGEAVEPAKLIPPQLTLLPPKPRAGRGGPNTEAYAYAADNDFLSVAQNPLSTFSVDADTASYSNVRRFVQGGQRPPRDAVRIEELINYFPYRYAPPPTKGDAPFATTLEVAEAPWAPTHRLVRIGLKGREVTTAERPAANLVFLLDVSGSMNAPNRLPLVKESLRLLLGRLRADDRVAIVTYAGQSGLALPSTPVARVREIIEALESLAPGGSTNGAMGIHLAYDIAKANFVTGGINRVILCTDGDFNVGATSEGELVRLIEEKAKSGVFLTVLGFGMGNLKDSTLEKLADKGNGNYGYIDSRKEAEKLLVQQVNGTLVTIAKDVKIQVEFNPSQVASYRLIGYENRLLKKEDFLNDKVDAGEIGAGHTVTALYEIVPAGAVGKAARKEPAVEERRYQFYGGVSGDNPLPGRLDPRGKELLLVKVRYKKPDGMLSRSLDFPLTDGGVKFRDATADFKFAAAVAGFGMLLRDSPHKGSATFSSVVEWAEAGADDDPGGHRAEFIELSRQAEALVK